LIPRKMFNRCGSFGDTPVGSLTHLDRGGILTTCEEWDSWGGWIAGPREKPGRIREFSPCPDGALADSADEEALPIFSLRVFLRGDAHLSPRACLLPPIFGADNRGRAPDAGFHRARRAAAVAVRVHRQPRAAGN